MNVETCTQIDEALELVENTALELIHKGFGLDIIFFALTYEVQAVRENIIEDIKAMPDNTRNEILQGNGGTVESYLQTIHNAVIRSITMPTKKVTPAKVDHKTLRKHIQK
jgi:hypothetical protein